MPAQPAQPPANGLFRSLIRWFDADHIPEGLEALLAPGATPVIAGSLYLLSALWEQLNENS